ncbi:MAG: DUF1573 domain-containing protein [Flavobacteriaceae bacterium]
MKKLFTLLLLSVFALQTYAQEKTAKIEFESKVIDYGTIEKGADGVRVFKFTNTGDAPLIVSKVKSSCGCTVPKKPEGPILPGESGEIQVKYDTNRVNPIRKTITVTSNADTPTVALKIKGTVIDPNNTTSVMKSNKKSVVEQ